MLDPISIPHLWGTSGTKQCTYPSKVGTIEDSPLRLGALDETLNTTHSECAHEDGILGLTEVGSSLACDYSTPQNAIPLIIMRGCSWARVQQNSVLHQKWTEEKDNGSIYQFKQGDP